MVEQLAIGSEVPLLRLCVVVVIRLTGHWLICHLAENARLSPCLWRSFIIRNDHTSNWPSAAGSLARLSIHSEARWRSRAKASASLIGSIIAAESLPTLGLRM